jgi:hypothetical protein
MVATDQGLVGRCAVEKGHARLSSHWRVYVEPERPFRMQEANLCVEHNVAGEEHFFAAGTDVHRHVAWRVTGRVESGDAGHHFRSGLDLAQAGAGQFQIRLGNHRLLLGGHFAGQFGIAPEGELSLAGDEFGRREQQRRVLAIADAPQVVEMEVTEQDHVDIARPVARSGEVAKQPAGRILEFVDAAACVDQHQLVASVDEGGVDLHHFRPRRVERGCEQASCVLGPIAPRRFRRERERAVADDGDLDGAELEAVEARLRPLARFGRMGEGSGGDRSCRTGKQGRREKASVHHHGSLPFITSPIHVLVGDPSSEHPEPCVSASRRGLHRHQAKRGRVILKMN